MLLNEWTLRPGPVIASRDIVKQHRYGWTGPLSSSTGSRTAQTNDADYTDDTDDTGATDDIDNKLHDGDGDDGCDGGCDGDGDGNDDGDDKAEHRGDDDDADDTNNAAS